jgi:hypothetical protein
MVIQITTELQRNIDTILGGVEQFSGPTFVLQFVSPQGKIPKLNCTILTTLN